MIFHFYVLTLQASLAIWPFQDRLTIRLIIIMFSFNFLYLLLDQTLMLCLTFSAGGKGQLRGMLSILFLILLMVLMEWQQAQTGFIYIAEFRLSNIIKIPVYYMTVLPYPTLQDFGAVLM